MAKPGTVDERARARRAAAQIVARSKGTAADLRTVLEALALLPEQDPAE